MTLQRTLIIKPVLILFEKFAQLQYLCDMRGEKVSSEKKNHKVERVLYLHEEEDYSISKACKRMRISRRTFYQYLTQAKMGELEDKRFKGLTEWQIATIELMIIMEPTLTLNEIVEGVQNMDLVIPLMNNEYNPNRVTKYKVWKHLTSRKGLKKDLEMASTLDERENIMIEKYGSTHTSYFKSEDWGSLRNILLPEKKR